MARLWVQQWLWVPGALMHAIMLVGGCFVVRLPVITILTDSLYCKSEEEKLHPVQYLTHGFALARRTTMAFAINPHHPAACAAGRTLTHHSICCVSAQQPCRFDLHMEKYWTASPHGHSRGAPTPVWLPIWCWMTTQQQHQVHPSSRSTTTSATSSH